MNNKDGKQERNDLNRIGQKNDNRRGNNADERTYYGYDIGNTDEYGNQKRIGNVHNRYNDINQNTYDGRIQYFTAQKSAKGLVCNGANASNALVDSMIEKCFSRTHNLCVELFFTRQKVKRDKETENDIGYNKEGILYIFKQKQDGVTGEQTVHQCINVNVLHNPIQALLQGVGF